MLRRLAIDLFVLGGLAVGSAGGYGVWAASVAVEPARPAREPNGAVLLPRVPVGMAAQAASAPVALHPPTERTPAAAAAFASAPRVVLPYGAAAPLAAGQDPSGYRVGKPDLAD